MPKLSRKNKLGFFISLIDNEEARESRLEEELRAVKERIDKLNSLINELKPCSKCGGRGETIWYDGGDSHFETCSRCKGSGDEPAD